MIPFIDLQSQYRRLQTEIETAIKEVLTHGQYIMGPEVLTLESRLIEYCGAKHAISCSNGTDAISLILRAQGIGRGDAVFVPSFSFVATAEVAILAEATPIFVDVSEEDFNLDPDSLIQGLEVAKRQGLTPKAVIVVDLFGMPANYAVLEKICEAHQLALICDAAQSFGGCYQRRFIGTVGLATATSFYPAKPLGCYGDGGAVFTDDDNLAAVMRSIREHGKGEHRYAHARLGFNARMDTLQAAILIEKLKVFAEELEIRNRVALRYNEALKDIVKVPQLFGERVSAWAQYTLQLPRGIDRTGLINDLKRCNIPTAIHYPAPIHRQPAYCHYPQVENLETSVMLSETVLSLPMHPYLTDPQQDTIIEALIALLSHKSSKERKPAVILEANGF